MTEEGVQGVAPSSAFRHDVSALSSCSPGRRERGSIYCIQFSILLYLSIYISIQFNILYTVQYTALSIYISIQFNILYTVQYTALSIRTAISIRARQCGCLLDAELLPRVQFDPEALAAVEARYMAHHILLVCPFKFQ